MAWTVLTSGRLSFYAWIVFSQVPLVVISFVRLALWIRSGCNIEKFESSYLGHGECGDRECGITRSSWMGECDITGSWNTPVREKAHLFYCDSGLCCYMCDCVLIICILYVRTESDCPMLLQRFYILRISRAQGHTHRRGHKGLDSRPSSNGSETFRQARRTINKSTHYQLHQSRTIRSA